MSTLTPLKAIRAKCLSCSCGSAAEVRECPVTECPLYDFRFGHNPKRTGAGGINPHESKLESKKRA